VTYTLAYKGKFFSRFCLVCCLPVEKWGSIHWSILCRPANSKVSTFYLKRLIYTSDFKIYCLFSKPAGL